MMFNKRVTILVLFFVIILGIASFFVVQNADLNNNQNTNKPDQPQKIIINGVDITNWKTYRNEEYGYLIKYPSDWVVREFPDTKTGADFTKDNYEIVIGSERSCLGQFDGSFDEYIYKLSHSINDNQYDLMKKFITISNVRGYIINWNESMRDYGVRAIFDNAYFEAKKEGFYKDRKVIKVRYNSGPTEYSKYSIKVFNTMIQTFDYID